MKVSGQMQRCQADAKVSGTNGTVGALIARTFLLGRMRILDKIHPTSDGIAVFGHPWY